MSLYRAKVKCFIDKSLREEGEVFEYCGPRNGCIESLSKVENQETPSVEKALEEIVPKVQVGVQPQQRKFGVPKAS